MIETVNYVHFTTAAQTATLGGSGSQTLLLTVNVNTSAASAVLTLIDVTSNATVAIIDCSAKISLFYGGIRVAGGLKATLSGGNADVTIGYS